MSVAQIKNLQRRLANLEAEATEELNRACGHELWQTLGFDAFDSLELSDHHLAFAQGLRLPLFQAAGMQLIKRLTLIAKDGKVLAVKYPIFPSNSDASWVLDWLGRQT